MLLAPLVAGDLGTDIDSAWDVPLRWGLATGKLNLGNALARRLSTPRGALHYDPSYGHDIRGKLNGTFSRTEIAQERSNITAECEKEERVQSCDCTFTYSFVTSSAVVTLVIDTADGTFELVLLVTSVSVAVLDRNQQTAIADAAGAVDVPVVINIGAPGSTGAPGVGTAGAAGTGGSAELPFNWLKRSSTGAEQLMDEQTYDFNNLAGGALTADLSGAAMSAAGTATIRIYVGGTLGSIDGTLVGSVAISSALMTLFTPMSVPFANPTGTRLVKVTLQSFGAGVQAQLLNPVVGFS